MQPQEARTGGAVGASWYVEEYRSYRLRTLVSNLTSTFYSHMTPGADCKPLSSVAS